MPHKTLAAALALVASAAAPAAAHEPQEPRGRQDAHRLVITVANSGADDGTYELRCHPAGGEHPRPTEACAAIDGSAAPFAAVPKDAMCTYMWGGSATAEVEGVWAGEPVRATFSRVNGCEIERWDALVPALPRIDG
ncbi:SSI family serine proteinase inhibitor [Streptomyces radicis]|uniref:Subtilisin inhibitor domain-containing protein n=1 Tax=Streptomyces radicis TaxID=1750517 RepID=A0A3A9WCX5_9ACTN|nr:SSI family serine proteinase inhibitor [Streptomyces radicis]RKN07214.1 hypothetical protein D7319_19225 [Streptomyces radicis]RKN26768.1 hypothetical protein D7318_05325 [Streptomyces radicis]